MTLRISLLLFLLLSPVAFAGPSLRVLMDQVKEDLQSHQGQLRTKGMTPYGESYDSQLGGSGTYIAPEERESYRIEFRKDASGRVLLFWRGKPLSTAGENLSFAISPEGGWYLMPKGQGYHSSPLRGGEVACAGMLQAENGALVYIDNHSGHYAPSAYYLAQALVLLERTEMTMDRLRVGSVDPRTEKVSVEMPFRRSWVEAVGRAVCPFFRNLATP